MLIGSNRKFELTLESGSEYSSGGAMYSQDKKIGVITIEPDRFPRRADGVEATAEIALVHETAHAVSTFFPEFAKKTGQRLIDTPLNWPYSDEVYAVNFENKYRATIGAELRSRYGGRAFFSFDQNPTLFPEQ